MRGQRDGGLPGRAAVPGRWLVACGGMWERLILSAVRMHQAYMFCTLTSCWKSVPGACSMNLACICVHIKTHLHGVIFRYTH